MKKINLKFLIFIVAILIVAILAFILYFKSSEGSNTVVNKIDSIENFDYNLYDRDTVLYEEEFYILKEILESETIDYELYAQQISKMFIIDFYTLNNKVSKYDVGGIEFMHSDISEYVSSKSTDTMYKYVSTMEYSELPEIIEVTVENVSEDNILYEVNEYTGYYVEVTFDYKKDLGYDTSGSFMIIKVDDKLEIIEYMGES
ncbi:MAG: hypothetical protein R3Y13_02810 [bacterium]